MQHYSIEPVILASIIHNNEDINKLNQNQKDLDELNVGDFTSPGNREIFKALVILNAEDKPFDESFIFRKMRGRYELELLEVLATTPINNLYPYIVQIKRDAHNRELIKAIEKLKDGSELDLEAIDHEIQGLQNLNDLKQKKSITQSMFDWFSKFSVNLSELAKSKVEYLIDGLIVKSDLTMIAGKPGVGKTLSLVAIINMALHAGTIKTVFYFDMDNSLVTLKDRNTDKVIEQWSGQWLHFHSSQVSGSEVKVLLRKLLQCDLSDCLVVFDSAKNFMNGKDRDKNRDVTELTDVFQRLRGQGATIIYLHHTRKPQHEMQELVYSGSSAWEEATSTAFILKNNSYKKTFLFEPFKVRTGNITNKAYKYDAINVVLHEVDFEEASEDEMFNRIREAVIDVIKIAATPPTYTVLMKSLTELQFAKNRINEVLQNGKGRYWDVVNEKQNNKTIYSLWTSKQNADKKDK